MSPKVYGGAAVAGPYAEAPPEAGTGGLLYAAELPPEVGAEGCAVGSGRYAG